MQSVLNVYLTAHCIVPNCHQRWSAAWCQLQELESMWHPSSKYLIKKIPKSQRRARNHASKRTAMSKNTTAWCGTESFFQH